MEGIVHSQGLPMPHGGLMMRAHANTKGAGASSSGRTGWVLVFAVTAFVITWGTGLAVVRSTQAELVNGAHVVPHALALPVAVVNMLLFVGAYGPALAAVAGTAPGGGPRGGRARPGQTPRWPRGPGRWANAARVRQPVVPLRP